MKVKTNLSQVLATSPAAAGTAAVTPPIRNLSIYDEVVVDAILLGATGGVLDVYLQRKVDTDLWADVAHFPQLAAGATAKQYTVSLKNDQGTIAAVGGGTDAAPAPALAANTVVQVLPGGDLRIVFVAGASTSAGAAQKFYFTGYRTKT